MRNFPTTNYSGLTVILEQPSRFDKEHLLTGLAGSFFEEECIKPWKLSSVDIRTVDDRNLPFIPGTKAVVWMGMSMTTPCGSNPCGYITQTGSIRHAQTWTPQDCMDPKQFELGDYEGEDSEDPYSDLDTKSAYPTRRTNYRFWTAQIIQKLLNPTKVSYEKIQISTCPALSEVTKYLSAIRDEDIYLDIETSPAYRVIQCIGISSSSIFPKVFVIPCYLYTGRRAYSKDRDFFRFHSTLSAAFQRNTVVIHNSSFDLLILHAWYKFHLPYSVYDTMLAGHRCYPEAEKSLSHNMVAWTELPFHKINSVETFSAEQQKIMWNYNARDVYCLKYIKDAQLAYAATVPGLTASINQVNSCIIPYLQMTLTGLPVDRAKQLEIEQLLIMQKKQLERIIQLLIDKPTFNPGSTKQCADFLHKELLYPVVGRTETGAPKLGKKQFYQLLLKHNNPALAAIIAYKKTAKDLSMLAFNLWSTPVAPEQTTTIATTTVPEHMVFKRHT